MSAETWYLPSCPAWCEGRHPCVLTGNADPTPEAEEWAPPVITHARALVDAPEGLHVDLSRDEFHPAYVQGLDLDPTARLFVYLPEHHEAEGATVAELRAWAQQLTDAADAADLLTGGQA